MLGDYLPRQLEVLRELDKLGIEIPRAPDCLAPPSTLGEAIERERLEILRKIGPPLLPTVSPLSLIKGGRQE